MAATYVAAIFLNRDPNLIPLHRTAEAKQCGEKGFAGPVFVIFKMDYFRPISMKKISGNERRMHPRLRVRWPVSILAADGSGRGETEDISLGGAFIRCQKPPPPNEKLLLTYKDDSSHIQFVLAQVVRTNHESLGSKDQPAGMGVQFLQFLSTPGS
jgi:hypothetical protein